ncbi:aminoglycoside phosphotransferase family protein [Bosea sp. 685]|uniref:phosphotransferase family protein n=1 Tax=Bosea sp. 685 TaxID=3080057 RepID=UPI00289368BE|nr:aminoglycoside phosphotransferase family protein [Bosea sp. 685]WNJ89608.1 aminoglycoside phosphotransferase family protein [Bosea sp. 685]
MHLGAITAILEDKYTSWRPEFVAVGQGLDSIAYRAVHPDFGPVVVKVPLSRIITNDNDEYLSSEDLLKQEVKIYDAVRSAGIPTPEPYYLHVGRDGLLFLLMSYVETDKSAPNGHECGAILRRLHNAKFDLPYRTVCCVEECTELTIAKLIVKRCTAISRLSGLTINLPSYQTLFDSQKSPYRNDSLLHLDYRSDNILCLKSSVKGVIDWSNALIGSPLIEIFRVIESNEFGDDFFRGYGHYQSCSHTCEIIYRLYTVSMLCIVFLSEAPDEVLARRYLDRLIELTTDLKLQLKRSAP